jgi:acetyltransferase-like isoleucine patch superfamily enzyme
MRPRSALHELIRRAGYEIGPRIASELRKRWAVLRNPQADIRFGRHTYLGPGFSLHIPGPGTFVTEPGVEFRRDFRAEVDGTGRVTIGAASSFTYSVVLQCTTSIEIGRRCVFAQATTIVDGNHRFRDLDRPMSAQGYDFRPLRIGDDVFVTAKSTVIADLGDRAVVAANSVVTRPVPPYCVAGGLPARVIEYFGPPGMEPDESAYRVPDETLD